MSAGQVMTGFSLSVARIVWRQLELLPLSSVAVQVMVVVPVGYGAERAALSERTPTIEATWQLSVAVAVPTEVLKGDAQPAFKGNGVRHVPAVHTEALLAAVEANRCY